MVPTVAGASVELPPSAPSHCGREGDWRSARALAVGLVGLEVVVAPGAVGLLLGDVAAERAHAGCLVGFDVEVAGGRRPAGLGDRADLRGRLVAGDDDGRGAGGHAGGGDGGDAAEAGAPGGENGGGVERHGGLLVGVVV